MCGTIYEIAACLTSLYHVRRLPVKITRHFQSGFLLHVDFQLRCLVCMVVAMEMGVIQKPVDNFQFFVKKLVS